MSQPFDRTCTVPPAGELDHTNGQFWVGNAWDISEQHNLSAYERKAAYLNMGRKPGEAKYANVSFLSAADDDGDGRTAVACDLNNDGMQDLVLRQVGGGPLIAFRNELPKQHWLRVRLRGVQSNGQGIGARVVARWGDEIIARDVYPQNTFLSQQPCEAHFGLGDRKSVDRLEIHWPSGVIQTLVDVKGDQLLRVREAMSPPMGASGK